ncbi:hypothetical protein [Paenibacillus xylanexedens]|uniref:hypothetical protein n=1 Tax=Paenibacillus xylanexedens TaxID=528191 RepID=UPI003D01255E
MGDFVGSLQFRQDNVIDGLSVNHATAIGYNQLYLGIAKYMAIDNDIIGPGKKGIQMVFIYTERLN